MELFRCVSTIFIFSLAFGQALAGKCNSDNVLRGIEHHQDYAFCSAFLATTGVNTATLVTPTYLTIYPTSRISSACSCINLETTASTTASTLSSTSSLTPKTSSSSTRSSSSTSSTSGLSSSSSSSSKSSTLSTSSALTLSTSSAKTSTSTSTSSTSSSKTSTSSSSASSSKTSTSTSSTSSSSSSSSTSTLSTSTTSASTTSASTSTSSSSTGTTSVPSITFTSVASQAYASKSTCDTLPTPTSSLSGASIIPANQTLPSLQGFFLSNNGTGADYLSLVGTDGNTYLIDFSDPTKLGIVDTSGNSLYIDSAGVHFATANCSLAIDVDIANFAQQIASQANNPSLQSREILPKRFSETSFAVAVQLTDQCQKPVTDLTPSLGVGPTPCSLASSGSGLFTFLCQWPGANSEEQKCETSINQWIINGLAGGLIGSTTNWSTVGKIILSGLEKALGREALLALVLAASITAGPEVLAALAAFETIYTIGVAGLAVLETLIAVYNTFSSGGLAQDVCLKLHGNEFPLPVTLQAGTSTEQLTSLGTAPMGTVQGSAVINDPNDTSCTTCTNGGSCSTYTNCNGGGSCYCGVSTENVNYCFLNDYCVDLVQCSGSADCGAGYLCLAGNCCGYNVCVDATTCQAPTNSARGLPAMARTAAGSSPTGGLTPIGWLNGTL